MQKKILVLLTGAIALSISAVPVLASDPPTDDGQYIWQDENGDYWYRNGSEYEYIGEGNYAPDPDSGELLLGDIVISADKVAAQAEEYGHSRRREFAFLIAHSMLHLMGYDHMTPEDAAEMERLQEEILQQLGIARQ